jgi:hypothetical protein
VEARTQSLGLISYVLVQAVQYSGRGASYSTGTCCEVIAVLCLDMYHHQRCAKVPTPEEIVKNLYAYIYAGTRATRASVDQGSCKVG